MVERAGRVQVLDREVATGVPFLDISSYVLGSPDSGASDEQGLFSIAFAPDYETSGRFYVCFTNQTGAVEIDEFTRSAGSPLRADRSSRRRVLVIPNPGAGTTAAGSSSSGPTALSIWGPATAPPGARRRPTSATCSASCCASTRASTGPTRTGSRRANPYVGRAGRDEIYAYGFRNPWRFSFDGGRLAIGDVGQTRSRRSTISRSRRPRARTSAGPSTRATRSYNARLPGSHPVTFPVHVQARHGDCAVTGGYVVRDPDLPSLLGRYLYGDFCRGWLRSFVPQSSRRPRSTTAPSAPPGRSSPASARALGGGSTSRSTAARSRA